MRKPRHAPDDPGMSIDPSRYRHLLALRDEAARLCASAEAEIGPSPTSGELKALRRIRSIQHCFEQRIAQLDRTLPDHPLPEETPRSSHP